MGAELCLSAVRWPSVVEDQGALSGWPNPLSESDVAELLNKQIATLSDDDLRIMASSIEEIDGVDPVKACGFDWDQYPLKAEHRVWALDFLQDAVKELIPLKRDSQLMLLGDDWWLVAGGTSYGDGFEETWNAMDVLATIGLLLR